MTFRERFNRTFNTFGLEKEEYELVRDRIFEDNRKKVQSASLILSFFLLAMLVLSFFVETVAHNRNIYSTTMVLTLSQWLVAKAAEKHRILASLGVYLFSTVALTFGIYQGIVTAPEEQVASFLVLLVAVPVWFTMKPSYMIRFIYVCAAIYIACVLHVKTGYVRTSDIVNTVVYSTASALISTYYTIIKSKRFYAEYLTERMSKSDMLTGLGNRHACMEDSNRHEKAGLADDMMVIYLDVNELKHVNDTLGHHAGDELICGAADCIKNVFGREGDCYRTGGDEFIVMGEFSEGRFGELCAEFDRAVASWKGSWGQELRISYGGAAAREVSGETLAQITKLADKRLYEAKALYYSTKGIDRREHQKAYRALCESYIMILQVNLTTDTCKVVHSEADDMSLQKGSSGCFSRWMQMTGNSGRIHGDDIDGFLMRTDVNYLREYFRSGKSNIHIFYRRKHGEGFRAIMTELMASDEYTDDNQIVYLYVKNIDRES